MWSYQFQFHLKEHLLTFMKHCRTLHTQSPPDIWHLLIILWTIERLIGNSFPNFLWGTLLLNISFYLSIFWHICRQCPFPTSYLKDSFHAFCFWTKSSFDLLVSLIWNNITVVKFYILALNCQLFWNVLQTWNAKSKS